MFNIWGTTISDDVFACIEKRKTTIGNLGKAHKIHAMKKIYFIDDVGHKIILVGMNRGVSLRFISTLQLKKSMRKGCKLYVVTTMNKKEDTMSIEQYPVLSKFSDVFPKELPGLPPKRELEFTIELKLGMKPITKAPYHMMTPEL
jgi:hypothetical protein